MLTRLRTSPWPTSLLVMILYGLVLVVPGYFRSGDASSAPATPNPTPTEIQYLIAQLPMQIVMFILLTGIVALMIWWRPVGFARHTKGSLKFTLVPLAYVGVMFAGAFALNPSGGLSFLGDTISTALLAILVSLLVGYTEELMFRGILFYGASDRFRLLWGTIISSVIFGLFHFVNLLNGQGFGWTVSQAVHAGSDGFMYAALRLITGSLWPTMILHGLWDLGVAAGHTGIQTGDAELAQSLATVQTGGVSIQPIQFLPGLLYGAFVLWRWSKRQANA